MARLIIYNSDANLGREHRPQRGDVIDILPDGVHPGTSVLGNDQFTVVDVSGDPGDFAGLCESVRDGDEKLTRYRAQKVDLDALLGDIAVKSGKTLDAKAAIQADVTDLRNAVSEKIALPDPRIIG